MGKGSKDNDVYYRKAKEEGWRARSAFKLLQIDSKFNILENVSKVVDLCAAPGSWSQVLSRKLYMEEKIGPQLPEPPKEIFGISLGDGTSANDVKIVAVDLQPMTPLPGVTQIQGDIMQYSTAEEIMNQFGGTKADLVVCDGAPDVTGLHSMDIYVHSQLLLGALHITCNVLKVGGNFIVKVFHHKTNDSLTRKLLILFKDVVIIKPPSSRVSSIEAFAVCLNYCPPEGFDPQAITPFLDLSNKNFDSLIGINRTIIPLLVNSDVSAWNTVSTEVEELQCEEVSLNPPPHSLLAFKPKSAEDIEKVKRDCENWLQMFNISTCHILQETAHASQNTSNDCNISHIPSFQFSVNKMENDFMDTNDRLSKLSREIDNEKWKFHKKIFNTEHDLFKMESKMKQCDLTRNF